jgi:SAM-dependent methyltransferase
MSASDPKFWQAKYQKPTQGWEIGRAAPPLERWFDAHPPTNKRALVVGCGRGHEARMLAARGARVTAVDFVDEAIDRAIELAENEGLHIDFRKHDLFRLAESDERYDLAVEHCCFCAIEPARREEYVDVIADMLDDGGELVALLWLGGRVDGPPFTVSVEEIERLFARRFVLTHMSTPEDSTESRRGAERLAVFAVRRPRGGSEPGEA